MSWLSQQQPPTCLSKMEAPPRLIKDMKLPYSHVQACQCEGKPEALLRKARQTWGALSSTEAHQTSMAIVGVLPRAV